MRNKDNQGWIEDSLVLSRFYTEAFLRQTLPRTSRNAHMSGGDLKAELGSFARYINGKYRNRKTDAPAVNAHLWAASLSYAIREQGLDQVAGSDQVRGLLEKILADNPKSVADYRGGKVKALDFLFGQAMRELKGAGDPALIRQILTELLG